MNTIHPLMKRLLCLPVLWLLLLVEGVPIACATVTEIQDKSLVFRVNDVGIHRPAIQMILANSRLSGTEANPESLVSSAVESRLLVEHATTQVEGIKLNADAVGFPLEVLVQDEVSGIIGVVFREQIDSHIKKNFNGDWQQIARIEKDIPLNRFQEQTVLLTHEPSAETLIQMKGVPVASAEAASGRAIILNLRDVFTAQNIQGKIALRGNDLSFLVNQAKAMVAKIYLKEWLISEQIVTQETLEELTLLIKDRHLKQMVMSHYGLSKDIHDDNPALNLEYEKVSQKEVADYYLANKDNFKRIEKVSARHIQVETEQKAKEVFQQIQDGMSFTDAVKKYSVAADASGKMPGSLGVMTASEEQSWWRSVVFALPEGTVSRPIRSPQSKETKVVWEMFLVESREFGHYPVDSETVRYLAGKEIAQKRLVEGFERLRKQLYESAKIELNSAVMREL